MAEWDRQWHCMVNGQKYGPIPESELRAWVAQRRVKPTDLVWTETMPNWQALESVQYMFRGGMALPPSPVQQVVLKPHRGVLVLVLGIVSIVFPLFGILGGITWYLANQDLPEIDAGLMDPTGRGMVVAGKVCGIIGFILGMVGCCWFSFWLIFAFGMIGSGGGF